MACQSDDTGNALRSFKADVRRYVKLKVPRADFRGRDQFQFYLNDTEDLVKKGTAENVPHEARGKIAIVVRIFIFDEYQVIYPLDARQLADRKYLGTSLERRGFAVDMIANSYVGGDEHTKGDSIFIVVREQEALREWFNSRIPTMSSIVDIF